MSCPSSSTLSLSRVLGFSRSTDIEGAVSDRDLARFIAAGRLTCSIDRVNGTVETHRPDAKNARYAAVIKQGDAVLTSVQRLSRVIG